MYTPGDYIRSHGSRNPMLRYQEDDLYVPGILTGLSIPGVGGSAPDGGGDGSGGGKHSGWSFRDV